jgi:hypothetical protein
LHASLVQYTHNLVETSPQIEHSNVNASIYSFFAFLA